MHNVSTVRQIFGTNGERKFMDAVHMSRKGFNLGLKISWQILVNQLQSTTNGFMTAKFIRIFVKLRKGRVNFLSSNWKVWSLYTGLSGVHDSN